MKRWALPCAKLALAAGLIYWLIRSGGLSVDADDRAAFAGNWPWLLAAQAPYAVVLLLAAIRWRLLLAVQGVYRSFGEIYSLVLMGVFFNQVLFGSTGGDVMKAYYVARESPERRAAAALTVFIDRAIGLFVLMALACAATFLNLPLLREDPRLMELSVFIWVAVGGGLAFAGLFYLWRRNSPPGKGGGIIRKLAEILSLYRSHPGVVLKAVAISVLLHSLVVITNLLLLRVLLPGEWPSLPILFFVIPLAQIVMAIPITPGAIGTAEAAYGWLFAAVGIPARGALVSLLQRLTYCFWALPGLLIYLRSRKKLPLDVHQEPRNADTATPTDEAGAGG